MCTRNRRNRLSTVYFPFLLDSRKRTFLRTAKRHEFSGGLIPSWDRAAGGAEQARGREVLHTNRVVFQQAHRESRARALKGVEEARHGHGDEADVDQTRLGYIVSG